MKRVGISTLSVMHFGNYPCKRNLKGVGHGIYSINRFLDIGRIKGCRDRVGNGLELEDQP